MKRQLPAVNNQTASFAEALRSYRAVTRDHRSPLDLPPAVLSRLLLQAHKLGRCVIVQPSLRKRVGLRLRAFCSLLARCGQKRRQSRIERFFGHGEGFDE